MHTRSGAVGGVHVEVGHAPPEQRVSLAEVVVDVETAEHRGDVPPRLVHAQQFGHRVAERLVTVVGAAERDLRHRVVQHPGTDRMPFGVVGVQQALGGCPVDDLGQLPSRFTASCTPVPMPWPPCGGCTWAASPASSTRPTRYEAACRAMSVNREIQLALRSPKSVPYTPTSASRSSLHAGVAGVVDVSFREHDPNRLPLRPPTDGMLADAVATEAELRLLVHLDLGDHPAGRGIEPGEVDAGRLADQAAPAVAADEVVRSERRVVGQLDLDAGVVLCEADHLAAAKDRNPELGDPVGQDGLELALPQREHVVVAGGDVAEVQRDVSEPVAG